MEEDATIRALAALAQRQRLRIYETIAASGSEGTGPSALADGLGLSPSLVSAHIAKLVTSGLIRRETDGKRAVVTIDADVARELSGRMDRLLGAR